MITASAVHIYNYTITFTPPKSDFTEVM